MPRNHYVQRKRSPTELKKQHWNPTPRPTTPKPRAPNHNMQFSAFFTLVFVTLQMGVVIANPLPTPAPAPVPVPEIETPVCTVIQGKTICT
ncbi:hypothetical protein K438DRAFT_1988788 [Mycena galopus ATCC 62051]|nr:hypothetical protein K438DRAFT_1988788 [Mycena galopus ATCC 62051]